MLVAAKCLEQEDKLEAAIDCTREVRALAARHSALPGGSSGVASTVTHEAFKLEVKPHQIVFAGSLDDKSTAQTTRGLLSDFQVEHRIWPVSAVPPFVRSGVVTAN